MDSTSKAPPVSLWNLKVYGIVQGVGFRPFVSRLAASCGILGSVANRGSYVEIFAQGKEEDLAAFREGILRHPPKRAVVQKLETAVLRGADEPDAPMSLPSFDDFRIVESVREEGEILVSPDIAICENCKRELMDPADRRYLHPFINCTDCGPRLTILDAMPYDRERTSMGEFPMCEGCEWEYTHPESRRYDAQPVCCNACGPEVFLLDREERGAAAITEARRLLSRGEIVAVKGIGGFHLACDATNAEAVRKLRVLKRRPFKPFAVMARSAAVADRECLVEPRQEEILDGPQKPILLLRKKPGGSIAEEAAPGNPKLGILLPYAPIHLLLFDYPDGIPMPDALIMTSGNPSGAPICRTDEDARDALSPLCAAILTHNRRIRLRADDSVMDWLDGAPCMIRRSRGYAPLPVQLEGGEAFGALRGTALAMGGELKNSFCFAKDGLFYPSPYLGDMTDLRTVEALRESIRRMETLLSIRPSIVACDLHPRYQTSEMARAIARERGIPLLAVQHHHAHILSCMAENGYGEPVIGAAFDGTGYGPDKSIWGGEFLLADAKGFRHLGSVQSFRQPGGDRSAREGWRIAVALLAEMGTSPAELREISEKLGLASPKELDAVCLMLDRNLNCVPSTSAGRLFDAASALLGIRRSSTFEGEAAMFLQFAAERWNGPLDAPSPPPLASAPDGAFRLPTTDWLFPMLLERRMAGLPPERLAMEFHQALALLILQGCRRAREISGLPAVALSGGVFQNTLLAHLVTGHLERDGFRVLRHSLIPPNDGGICLGQALFAMAHLSSRSEVPPGISSRFS